MPYTPGGQWIDFDAAAASRRQSAALAIDRARKTEPPPVLFDLSGTKRVALVRRGGIGDVLMCTPLARHLALCGVEIEMVTARRHRCLLDLNTHCRASDVPISDYLEAGLWDKTVDLHACPEQETYPVHQAWLFGALCGLDIADLRVDYTVRPTERERARDLLAPLREPVVTYVREAMGGNLSWTDDSHTANLAALDAAGLSVAVLAGTRFDLAPGALNLTGRTSLREAAAIIAESALVVSPDTGLFHIAQAVGVPTLTYFGAFPLSERASSKATLLNEPYACGFAPCRQHCCAFVDQAGNVPCIAIDPARLVQQVLALL